MKRVLASNQEPEIAVFWYIDHLDKFIGDRCSLSDGVYYGDFGQVDVDHFDRWPIWRKEYGIKEKTYDYYPRGRVMFNSKIHKFVVVCDKCIANNEDLRKSLCYAYNLPADKVVWDTDSHYSCKGCRRPSLW